MILDSHLVLVNLMFLSPHHKLPQMHSSYRMAFHLLRVPTIQLHNCIMYVCERGREGMEREREGGREGEKVCGGRGRKEGEKQMSER